MSEPGHSLNLDAKLQAEDLLYSSQLSREGDRKIFWWSVFGAFLFHVAVMFVHFPEAKAVIEKPDKPVIVVKKYVPPPPKVERREVIHAAFRAFRESGEAKGCTPYLAERFLRALEAGAARGGDNRCPRERAALTAFVAVVRPEDPADAPSLFLVAPSAFGLLGSIRHMLFPYSPSAETPPAVAELREMYEEWLRTDPKRKRSSCDADETEAARTRAKRPQGLGER